MSSKDDFLFRKSALMGTKSGKEILKQGILREKGYKQFYKYNNNIEERRIVWHRCVWGRAADEGDRRAHRARREARRRGPSHHATGTETRRARSGVRPRGGGDGGADGRGIGDRVLVFAPTIGSANSRMQCRRSCGRPTPTGVSIT